MSCWILRTVSEVLSVLCAGSNPLFEPFWWLWSFGGGFHGAGSEQNLYPTAQVPASWYLLAPRATCIGRPSVTPVAQVAHHTTVWEKPDSESTNGQIVEI